MSENFAGLSIYLKPFKFKDYENNGEWIQKYYNRQLLGYRIGFTVTEDSHHENNSNFSATVKKIYISKYEYAFIFKLMTGVGPVTDAI